MVFTEENMRGIRERTMKCLRDGTVDLTEIELVSR